MVRSHAVKRPGAVFDADETRAPRRVKLTARSPSPQQSKVLRLVGAADVGFRQKRLHAVQIGLGTFCTIPENLVGSWKVNDKNVGWLLRSCSERRPKHFRGVVVEPVPEHLDRCRKLGGKIPHMRFAQVAVSDEAINSIELQCVTQNSNDELVQSAPREVQTNLEKDLVYLRNMGSVGGKHPFLENTRNKIWQKYKVDVKDAVRKIRTEVWNYAKLAKQYDFCGTELLMIDTEGHDTKIIRSMIEHCLEQDARGKCSWPDVIAFETCGICDKTEGSGAEVAVIKELEKVGYAVFMKHWMNTHMVRLGAVPHLTHWLKEIPCTVCKTVKHWPLTMNPGYTITCERCHLTHPELRNWMNPKTDKFSK